MMRHEHKALRSLLALYACLLVAVGCGRERARAVRRESGPRKDYRQMLERTRSRQTTEQQLSALEKHIQTFQTDLGRTPTNLYELVRLGYIEELPAPPEGHEYIYMPDYGNVMFIRLKDEPAEQDKAESRPPRE